MKSGDRISRLTADIAMAAALVYRTLEDDHNKQSQVLKRIQLATAELIEAYRELNRVSAEKEQQD